MKFLSICTAGFNKAPPSLRVASGSIAAYCGSFNALTQQHTNECSCHHLYDEGLMPSDSGEASEGGRWGKSWNDTRSYPYHGR